MMQTISHDTSPGVDAHHYSARPEIQRERWRRHYRRIVSIKDEKNVFQRFFADLKIFLLDTWFDILCILITCAIAAAVGISSKH
jgi:hypothetical protein